MKRCESGQTGVETIVTIILIALAIVVIIGAYGREIFSGFICTAQSLAQGSIAVGCPESIQEGDEAKPGDDLSKPDREARPEPGGGPGGGSGSGGTSQQKLEEAKKLLGSTTKGQELLKFLTDKGIPIELQGGDGSFYDPNTGKIVINDAKTAEGVALTLAHEGNHALFDKEGRSADIDKDSREDYVRKMIEEEAIGTAASIELKRDLKAGGRNITDTYPLESEYNAAFDKAVADLKKSNPSASAADLDAAGRGAGLDAVRKGFETGKVQTSTTKESYPDFYGREHDERRQTGKPESARPEPLFEAARKEAERRNRIVQDKLQQYRQAKQAELRQKQIEQIEKDKGKDYADFLRLLDGVDASSADADEMIELIDLYASSFPEGANVAPLHLFIAENSDTLKRLLGPFGFRSAGARQVEILQRALDNWREASAEEREMVRWEYSPAGRKEIEKNLQISPKENRSPYDPDLPRARSEPGRRFAESTAPTAKEIEAQDAQQVEGILPDGTRYRGPRWAYRNAHRQAVANKARATRDFVINLTNLPAAGRGRGGRGGRQGSGGGAQNPVRINTDVSGATGGTRPIVQRPVNTNLIPPAGSVPGRPVVKDAARDARLPRPRHSRVEEMPDPPARPPAQGNQQQVALDKTQPGAPPAKASVGPNQPTGADRNTGGMDPDRVRRRAEQQVRDAQRARAAEQQAAREARDARRQADLARRAAAAKDQMDRAARTLPKPGESISPTRALNGLENRGWPVVASLNSRRHAEVWNEVRRPGDPVEPPTVFRDGNMLRIDFNSLNDVQKRRFEKNATFVRLPAVGDATVNVLGDTQPPPAGGGGTRVGPAPGPQAPLDPRANAQPRVDPGTKTQVGPAPGPQPQTDPRANTQSRVDPTGPPPGARPSSAPPNASKVGPQSSTGPEQPRAPPVHMGQQGKHIEGHNNFIKGRSVLRADPFELAQKAGTGTPVGNVPRGQPGFKERVDFGKVIGDFVKDGVATPTTKGIIHYGKGGIHIVPAAP